MSWGYIGGAAVSLVGGHLLSKGSKSSGDSTTVTKQELDPRAAAVLYGDGTKENPGWLSTLQGYAGQAQNPGAANYAQTADDYLLRNRGVDFNTIASVANRFANGGAVQAHLGPASTVEGLQYFDSAKVNAPSQNNIDLSGAYTRFISGASGDNPYLTGAIGKGINQSNNAFNAMQQSATDNLQKNLLPAIRSNSVASGLYGSSRQGIAEGNALGDFAKAQQQAISQFGQNNTDAAVAAQSQNYNLGQDRALAATQGLGAQQYGVAQQNAAMQQQANLQAQSLNAARASQNSAQQQQAYNRNTDTYNNVDAINAQAMLQGANLLGSLGSGSYNTSNSAGNYGLNQISQVNSLLSPYLSLGGSSSTTTPLYSNTGANLIGGAAAGLSLYNQFRNMNNNGVGSSSWYANNDYLTS